MLLQFRNEILDEFVEVELEIVIFEELLQALVDMDVLSIIANELVLLQGFESVLSSDAHLSVEIGLEQLIALRRGVKSIVEIEFAEYLIGLAYLSLGALPS